MKKEIVEAILTAINLTLIYLINNMAGFGRLISFCIWGITNGINNL